MVCGYVKNEKQLYDANGPRENLKRAVLIFLSAHANDYLLAKSQVLASDNQLKRYACEFL